MTERSAERAGQPSAERETEWLGAAEAAERLGIKPASLYAYVSRGVLARRQDPGGRGSLYDAAEVAKLARRGRPRRAPSGSELVIESGLTLITRDGLSYRGRDVLALARTTPFEEVALLLWTLPAEPGPAPVPPAGAAWQATPAALAAGAAAQAALPPGILPLERLQVIVPALAAADPLRLHLDRPAVIAAARALIAGMADCLPPAGGDSETSDSGGAAGASVAGGAGGAVAPGGLTGPAGAGGLTGPAGAGGLTGPAGAGGLTGPAGAGGEAPDGSGSAGAGRPGADLAGGGPIAGRLVRALCPGVPPAGLERVVEAALVLLADHDLAASTLAARVAASVRADPYAVVATGLGAVGGALHGGASLAVEDMLRSAATPGDAPRVVGELLRRGQRIPGFGHLVYQAGDPRFRVLLAIVREHAPDSPRLAVADALLAEAHRRALPEPNIDFAAGTLTDVAGLVPGSGEAIFAVARAAGWVAHALEEYDRRLPIRPRSVYTGPHPA